MISQSLSDMVPATKPTVPFLSFSMYKIEFLFSIKFKKNFLSQHLCYPPLIISMIFSISLVLAELKCIPTLFINIPSFILHKIWRFNILCFNIIGND